MWTKPRGIPTLEDKIMDAGIVKIISLADIDNAKQLNTYAIMT